MVCSLGSNQHRHRLLVGIQELINKKHYGVTFLDSYLSSLTSATLGFPFHASSWKFCNCATSENKQWENREIKKATVSDSALTATASAEIKGFPLQEYWFLTVSLLPLLLPLNDCLRPGMLEKRNKGENGGLSPFSHFSNKN